MFGPSLAKAPTKAADGPAPTLTPKPPQRTVGNQAILRRLAQRPSGAAASAAAGTASPPSVETVLRAPGQPLDPSTRAFMEPRFGQDFSRVRVHDDAAAARSAEQVDAQAYTVGDSIVFGPGRYAPSTDDGRRLIAHELAHVAQQAGRAPALQRKPKHTAQEREAILAKAAQAAFTSYEEQLDAQIDAEALLSLNSKKNKDKAYAWCLGREDKAKIQKSKALTPDVQHEITVKIRFFEGEAKSAYMQFMAGAIAEVAEGEQVSEILAEPSVPGAKEEDQAQGLGCDAGKKQFPLLYEGEPERSTCIDITTDKDFASHYFDDNIASAKAYAVPGTTWENVEYTSFKTLLVSYKNGTSEYFMLTNVGNFYSGGKPLGLTDFFYYKRKGTGLIYPVNGGKLYSSQALTAHLIAEKNGLQYTVKDLQGLYTLLQTAGTFANIIGSYSVVEAFRVSLEGFQMPRGSGKGGGKAGGGTGGALGGEGEEPVVNVRAPGGEHEGGVSPHETPPPQKMLSSRVLKGSGNLTSDPVHPNLVKRGAATEGETVLQYKQRSTNPDDLAEARMAVRLSEDGFEVHFRANDEGGDLIVEGVKTEVKHVHGANIANQMTKAAQQGVSQVIIDGSSVGLTDAQVRTGIDAYEERAGQMVVGEGRRRHPALATLKTAWIVKGDGSMYVYHRDTSMKKGN